MASTEPTKAVKSSRAKGGVIKQINDGIAAKEAEKKNATPPAEPTAEVIPPEPKRKPGQAVQPPLPNTEEGAPQISDDLKALLPRVDDAIYQAATWKQTENDLKATIADLMGREGLNEVSLPGRGKLRYSPGKPKVSYIKPPSKTEGAEAAGSNEEGDGDEE